MDQWLQDRLREAWALIGMGDRFGIGQRFLLRHGLVADDSQSPRCDGGRTS